MRAVRKFFASLTGLHGFFSGRTRQKKKEEAEALAKKKKQKELALKQKQQALAQQQKKEKRREETKEGVESPPEASRPPAKGSPSLQKKIPAEDEHKNDDSDSQKKKKKKSSEATPEAVPEPESSEVETFAAYASKKKEPTVRTKPDRSDEGEAHDMQSASQLAAKRLGIDPALLQPRVASQRLVKPVADTTKGSPRPTSTPTLTPKTPQVPENVEKEEVDDALARIDAVFSKPAPKKKTPIARQPTTKADPKTQALFAAVERHDPEAVVRFVEEEGVSVDSRDPSLENYTCLFVAAEEADETTIDALVSLGADVEARDNKGRTPLYAACLAGQAHVAADLIFTHHANPNVRDNTGRHVFWAACALGRVDVAEAILDASARRGLWTVDLDAKDPCGLNATDFAKARRNSNVLAFLERHGAHESSAGSGSVKHQVNQYELLEIESILNSS